jgi:O-antigen/teichoic acid export membrane protein
MLRRLLKDSAIYTVPSIFSRGLSLILVPVYTRVMDPADYGSFDLLMIFASIINLTIALEISQGVARFYASESDPIKRKSYVSTAFWFTLVCYTIFTLGILFLSPYISEMIMGRSGYLSEFQTGIIYIFFNGIFYFIQNQLRWEFRSRQYAILSFVMTFVTAATTIWLAYFLKWGFSGLMIGMLIGCSFATLIGLFWLQNSLERRFNFSRLLEMLSFSTPLVFSGIAVFITQYIDRLMINYFLSIEQVGLYGIGYRLASVASIVMVGFQSALTPLIYANLKNPDTPQQLERIFRIFIFFALLFFLVLTLFSIDILKLLTTSEFYNASVVIVYLVPAVFLANMYIFSPGISIAKKTHLIFWINIGGCSVNIFLNYLFIPILGINGAGLATCLSYVLIFWLYVKISQKFYLIPYNWLIIILATSSAITLVIILSQIKTNDLVRWLLNCMALTIFCVVAFSVGLIQKHEVFKVVNYLKVRLKF